MIRRFVVIVAVLSIMITPIYADEIIASSEGENDSFSFEKYIPNELSGLLDEYGVDDAEEIDS